MAVSLFFVFLHRIRGPALPPRNGSSLNSGPDLCQMRSTMNSKYLKGVGHLAALVTVVAWGGSFISTKVLMEDGGFTPVEVYVYRFAIAYFLMLAITFRKILSNNLKDELQFLLCGVCAGTLYFLTENYALKYTTAGNVSLLSAISPIFTTLLVALVFRTRITKGAVFGSFACFAGVALVIFSPAIALGSGFEIHPLGDILALTCAVSWAVYSVAVRRLLPLYSTFFVTRKLFFYGVLTALPLLFFQHEPYHLHLLFETPKYFLNLLFLVIMCSVAAYLLWNEAMKLIGSVAANNYLYLQPLVTMVAGWWFFGEHIYLWGYVGCALIIAGLVIADRWISPVSSRKARLENF